MGEINLRPYENELLQILESDLSDKETHVQRLATFYKDDEQDILESFYIWQDLQKVKSPTVRPEMDAAFYKMLTQEGTAHNVIDLQSKNNQKDGSGTASNIWKYAVAATFLLGLFAGQWLDLGPSRNLEVGSTSESNLVQFANLDATPLASDRMKEITRVKGSDEPTMKVLEALNKTLLYDPNINVRLSAMETLALFSDIPEAREYLIKAIPFQTSSIIQLELADIMIALEGEQSAEAWEQLLSSDNVDTEVRISLQHTLKKIL